MHVNETSLGYEVLTKCGLSLADDIMLHRLAAKAFNSILRRKQCKYGPVLEWLDGVLQRSAPTEGKELMKLARVVRKGEAAFKSYKY